MLVVFQRVAPPVPGDLGIVGRREIKRRDGGVERQNVVDRDPEVVVRRQHREPQQDQRAAPNQESAGATLVNRPEERNLVEIGRSHVPGIIRV